MKGTNQARTASTDGAIIESMAARARSPAWSWKRFFAEWSESGIRTKENHRKKYRGARGCRCTGQKTPRRRHRLGRSSRLQNAADSQAHQHRHRQVLELVTQAVPAPTLEKNRLHRVLGRMYCSQTHASNRQLLFPLTHGIIFPLARNAHGPARDAHFSTKRAHDLRGQTG